MYYYKVMLYMTEENGDLVELSCDSFETELEARRKQFDLIQKYSMPKYSVVCVKAIRPIEVSIQLDQGNTSTKDFFGC